MQLPLLWSSMFTQLKYSIRPNYNTFFSLVALSNSSPGDINKILKKDTAKYTAMGSM